MARVARWILPLGMTGLEPLELPPTGPVVIGRGPDCQLHIAEQHKHVSKKHCRLAFSAASGHLEVEDLSRRGTFVNGVEVATGKRQALYVGDEVSLARPSWVEPGKRQALHEGAQLRFLVAAEALPPGASLAAGPAGPPCKPSAEAAGAAGSAGATAGEPDRARASVSSAVVRGAGKAAAPPKEPVPARGAAAPPPPASSSEPAAPGKSSCTDPSWHAAGKKHPLVMSAMATDRRAVTLGSNASKFASSRVQRRLGITVADPAGTMQKMYDKLIGAKLGKLGAGPEPPPGPEPQRPEPPPAPKMGARDGKDRDSKGKDMITKKDKNKHKKAKKKKDKKTRHKKSSASSSDGSSNAKRSKKRRPESDS